MKKNNIILKTTITLMFAMVVGNCQDTGSDNSTTDTTTSTTTTSTTPTVITIDNGEFSDSLTAGEVIKYEFTAAANSAYAIVWNDSWEGDGSKTADIKITVKNSGGSILYDHGTGVSFSALDSGYTTYREVFSTVSDTFTISVQGISTSSSGTYGVEVVSMSSPIAVQITQTTDTIVYRTPSLNSDHYYRVASVTPGNTYTVEWEDLWDQTAAIYSQDLIVAAYYVDSFGIVGTAFSWTDNGFTLPRVITASYDTLFISAIRQNTITTAPGFAIAIY